MMLGKIGKNISNVSKGERRKSKNEDSYIAPYDQKRLLPSSDGDILGNKVETLHQDFASGKISSPEFRGSISLAPVSSNETTQPSILDEYREAANICATEAINIISNKESTDQSNRITLDIGKCILCGRCQDIAPNLFRVNNESSLPTKRKADLMLSIPTSDSIESQIDKNYERLGNILEKKIQKIFGRSLAIREVDAGSCNGCEVEITALNNPIYDIERFGIHFVASPRHADVLLVTGPASRNMEIALQRTYEATPNPKLVIAVGACACSGGIFGDTYATTGGIDKVVPVDVYIPGCPPRPQAILYGLLLALDRVEARDRNV